MIVKLRGGPMANTYKEVDSTHLYYDRLEVRVPNAIRWTQGDLDSMAIDSSKRGHYAKTNITTRNGAVVYQWMGFEGEVIAR